MGMLPGPAKTSGRVVTGGGRDSLATARCTLLGCAPNFEATARMLTPRCLNARPLSTKVSCPTLDTTHTMGAGLYYRYSPDTSDTVGIDASVWEDSVVKAFLRSAEALDRAWPEE